jgi:hypothetical protein
MSKYVSTLYGFLFDEMDHNWLMPFLKLRVADKPLIGKWLKAGIKEEVKLTKA